MAAIGTQTVFSMRGALGGPQVPTEVVPTSGGTVVVGGPQRPVEREVEVDVFATDAAGLVAARVAIEGMARTAVTVVDGLGLSWPGVVVLGTQVVEARRPIGGYWLRLRVRLLVGGDP